MQVKWLTHKTTFKSWLTSYNLIYNNINEQMANNLIAAQCYITIIISKIICLWYLIYYILLDQINYYRI